MNISIDINNCQRGYILSATDRDRDAGYHSIVFYAQYDGSDFIGAMLTHKVSQKNAQMDENHFEKEYEDGNSWDFEYDDSKIVIAKLRKFGNWGPFTKIGELTDSGIKFVEYIIDSCNPETWDDYKRRTRSIPD
jgi:hypothetical protein